MTATPGLPTASSVDLRGQLVTTAAIVADAAEVAMAFTHHEKRWDEKSSATDLVTEADRTVESLVVDRLREAFPDDDVVAEEGSVGTVSQPREGRRRWYVDPIDGTTNYLKGLPLWGVSIGLADPDDDLLLGVIAMPATGEVFTAARGHGAFRNGVPIQVSAVDTLDRALISYALTGHGPELWGAEALGNVRSLMRQALGTRMQGCSVADLTSVAVGRIDATVGGGMSPWDVAAGMLICTEAGARISGPDGRPASGPVSSFVVSGPGIHDAVLDVLLHRG